MTGDPQLQRCLQSSPAIPLILEYAENGLSSRMRRTIGELYDLFNALVRRIHFLDKEIETVFRQSEACQHIAKVDGDFYIDVSTVSHFYLYWFLSILCNLERFSFCK